MASAIKSLEKTLLWPVPGAQAQRGVGAGAASARKAPAAASTRLGKQIDRLEQATRARTRLPALDATVAGRRTHMERRVQLQQVVPIAQSALGMVGRLGCSAMLGCAVYTVLSNTAAVIGIVVTGLSHAGTRSKLTAMLFPANKSRPAGGAAPSTPLGATVLGALPAAAPAPAAAGPEPAPAAAPAPAQLPAVAHARVSPSPSPVRQARANPHDPALVAAPTRAMLEGSRLVLERFAAGVFDGRNNLVETNAGAWTGDAWWRAARQGGAEAQAGKVSAASLRAREQVGELRHLSAQQALFSARARAQAEMLHRQRLAAEHAAIPTLMYRLAAASVLTTGALVVGSALGAIASVVFVFPCAYLIYGSLTARQQRDSKATATAVRCREEERRQLGFAREHAWLSCWLDNLAEERTAQWREAAALWRQASAHAPTASERRLHEARAPSVLSI